VFGIDRPYFPNRGGELKIVAATPVASGASSNVSDRQQAALGVRRSERYRMADDVSWREDQAEDRGAWKCNNFERTTLWR
jgi:hypothetical protein